MSEHSIYEHIFSIEKFLKQLDKTFIDAQDCRKCSESCGDIFYNGYKRIKQSLVEIEKSVNELDDIIKNSKDLEKEQVLIIVPDEIVDELEKEIDNTYPNHINEILDFEIKDICNIQKERKEAFID